MQINAHIVTPQNGTKAKQLVLILHGYGADGANLIGLCDFFRTEDILPNAVYIAPNAPYPHEMGGAGYQWWGLQDRNPDKMLEGVVNAGKIMNDFIEEQMQEHGVTGRNVVLIGFSQGTMLSLHIGLNNKNVKTVLGYSGALIDNLEGVDIINKPNICLIHGTKDDVVPFKAMENAKEELEAAGLKPNVYALKGLSHQIDMAGVDIGKNFVAKYKD